MAKINNTSTVTYKYTLPDTTVKSSSANSNFSSTENMTTSFTKVKSANKTYAMAGDEIQITLVLTNNSDYDITDISIKDTIDTKATFKTSVSTLYYTKKMTATVALALLNIRLQSPMRLITKMSLTLFLMLPIQSMKLRT